MYCPKCNYRRTEQDTDVMPGVCPACAIAYNKWREGQDEDAADRVMELPAEPLGRRLYYYLLFMPSDRHESAFWGHALIYVVFVIWGWSFILHGIDWIYINSSFLHMANLAFHEYGHVAFSPFGEFMTILGGSLFQILLPLVPMFAFIIYQRDNFAASIMLWWCGQNFIDVSPYIADARERILPLIGGLGQEAHDWGNLLRMTGTLDQTPLFAGLCFGIGVLLIIASNLWGATLLLIELKGRGAIGGPDEV